MNKIVACGCSFTYNLKIENNHRLLSYPTIIGEKLNIDVFNLSKPGSSNYCIAKQIEYSIGLNPDLVLIGLTTPVRLDWKTKDYNLNTYPSFNDWMTSFDTKILHKNKYLVKKYGNISSNPLTYFVKNIEKNDKFKDYISFLSNTDYFIQKDKDYFTILGACSLLDVKGIKYIIIDFSENRIANSINCYWKELEKMFPWVDGIHFNQDGHNYIANIIINKIKNERS